MSTNVDVEMFNVLNSRIKIAPEFLPARLRIEIGSIRYLTDDQVSVFFAFADFLHSALSWANCSAERIPFACLRNVFRLSFVQPAFMHSACHASILLC